MFLPSNITLKFGDSGDFVAELQRRLAMVHCFSNDQVNGFYDGATVNGVMQFQGMNGLHADGVAGPETLRRLNGVIAGDSGGSTDNKSEEEAKQLAATQAQQVNLALAEQPAPAMWGEPAPQEAPAPAAVAAAPGLDPNMFAPAAAAFVPPVDQADLALRNQISQNPAQDLSDLLAAAQIQQQQQSLAAAPPQPVPQARPPEPQSFALQPEPIPVAPPPLQAAPVAPAAEPVAAEPQAQQSGIIQRAGRFANAMMQKLSDYFEAKLPPSVMAEVKAAGAIMAASGMKEAPIPTGPEMAGPAQQVPTRGPDQQQAQVR